MVRLVWCGCLARCLRGVTARLAACADAGVGRSKQPPDAMKLNSIEDFLIQEVKDLHSAESQLLKALPKLAKAATSEDLREAFETHHRETEVHVQRLEQAMEEFGGSVRGRTCEAMKGLLAEADEIMKAEGDETVKDAALIIAAQKVEHYEIAGYGSARALAEALGYDELAAIFNETLEEESATDEKFSALAETVNAEAVSVSE